MKKRDIIQAILEGDPTLVASDVKDQLDEAGITSNYFTVFKSKWAAEKEFNGKAHKTPAKKATVVAAKPASKSAAKAPVVTQKAAADAAFQAKAFAFVEANGGVVAVRQRLAEETKMVDLVEQVFKRIMGVGVA